MGDELIRIMPDPLSAVLLFFLIGLAGAVLAMARYVATLHENSVKATLEQVKVQEGLKGTLEGMSRKMDATASVDQQLIVALAELKATLKPR